MSAKWPTAQSTPAQLRAAAEAALAGSTPAEGASRSATALLHELQVHQIELEMQNESLLQVLAALEESRDRYVDLYDFAPVGYLMLSEAGLIMEINFAGAALLGADRSRLHGQRFDSHVAITDRVRWQQHFADVMAQAEKQSLDLQIRHSDGSLADVRLDCMRADKAGMPPGLRITLTDITERKRAETELRMREEFHSDILDSLSSQIAVVDDAGVIVAVNEPWRRFSLENSITPGQSAAQTDVGTNYLSVCEIGSADASPELFGVRDGIQAVLDRQLPGYSVEYSCHTVERQRWFSMSATPLRSHGQGVVIAHVDITERKKAEAALLDRDFKLSALVANSPSVLSLKHPDGRYALTNPNLQHIHHRSDAEIIGKTDFDLYPEEVAIRFRRSDELVLSTRTRHSIEEIVPVDGLSRTFISHMFPVFDAVGGIRFICRISLDVTDRKLAERALHEAYETLLEREAELTEAQRIAHFGNWYWDAKSGEDRVSEEVCQIFGWKDLPAFAKQCGSIYSPETWEQLNTAVQNVLITGVGYDLELPALHKDGTRLWINTRCHPVFSGDGEVLGLRGTVQDITVRKRAEDELKTLRHELQHVLELQVVHHTLAALAHEINQPLSTISALCEAAIRLHVADSASTSRSKQLDEILRRMAGESERAGSVVRDLMDSLNQPDTALQSIVLPTLLDEAVRIAISSEFAGFEVLVECAIDMPPVRINRLQIEKVLLNLIGNAMQAMRAAGTVNGRIWISAAPDEQGASACISVRDEGPGIGQDMATLIFHPFASTKPGNLGMGLAISRSLVEAHGGRLWLEVHDGPGAIFHFTVPFAR